MKQGFLLFTLAFFSCVHHTSAQEIQTDSLHFSTFGTVHLYQKTKEPDQVVLFILGGDGWNAGVVEMAKMLAEQNALVVGINIDHLFRNLAAIDQGCIFPAAHFQDLAEYVQRERGLSEYHIPLLAGYSSGAPLVYVLLAEAPVNTFAGGMSLGFSPELDFAKPFFKRAKLQSKPKSNKKGYFFFPVSTLDVPWIVLQGTNDQVSNPVAT